MMRLSIAGWIESLLFAAAVLLYISGESGWILVYAIGISAALSVMTCAVSRRNFTISCSGCSGLHHVGDTVTVELELTPQGFCFLPYITISGRFLGQRFTARGSVLGKSGKVRISLTAPECGLSRLEIDSATLRDFLGIVYLNSRVRPEPAAVAVLPRIVDYTGPEVPLSLLPSDDDEDAAQSLLTGGIPGYDHREIGRAHV